MPKARLWLQRPIYWSLILGLVILLVSCTNSNISGSSSPKTLYTEEQPSLSGNGKFLAFVSNSDRVQRLVLYDLEKQSSIPTPGLNRPDTIAESPSLSYNGRYICYLTSDQGRSVAAIYDRATQLAQIITPNYRSWIRHPYISVDGRYVVFESARRGQWDIEVLDRGPIVELDIPNGSVVNNLPP